MSCCPFGAVGFLGGLSFTKRMGIRLGITAHAFASVLLSGLGIIRQSMRRTGTLSITVFAQVVMPVLVIAFAIICGEIVLEHRDILYRALSTARIRAGHSLFPHCGAGGLLCYSDLGQAVPSLGDGYSTLRAADAASIRTNTIYRTGRSSGSLGLRPKYDRLCSRQHFLQ